MAAPRKTTAAFNFLNRLQVWGWLPWKGLTPAKRAVAKRLEKDGIVSIDGDGEEKGVSITDAGELLIGEWNSEGGDEATSSPADDAEERAREDAEMRASRFTATAIEHADPVDVAFGAIAWQLDTIAEWFEKLAKGLRGDQKVRANIIRAQVRHAEREVRKGLR